MPAPTQGRARLERALINVHRAGRARRPEGRRHVVPASSGSADSSRLTAPSEVGAEWSAPAGSAPPPDPEPEAAAPEPAEAEPAVSPQGANGLAEIVERLRKIEERLASIQEHERPAAATPELFAEWVRMRHWQEIPFAEFLKLRRAGRI